MKYKGKIQLFLSNVLFLTMWLRKKKKSKGNTLPFFENYQV